MLNEDTGKAIECPYCGSQDDCPHLLAVIDKTFLECSGGYVFSRFQEFGNVIEEAFLTCLKAGGAASKVWTDENLQELWMSAKEEFSKSGAVWLDGDSLFRLVVALLEDAGGEQYYGPIDDEGGPGYSSAITLFHAKVPQMVFEVALLDLKHQLSDSPS